jgi:two-component system C4-dicarboxylate transport response regulator DctD
MTHPTDPTPPVTEGTDSPEAPATPLALIEDDVAFRAGVAATLRMAGYDVTAFGAADEALSHLAAAPVELVLTDLRLPGIDGLQVLQRCRAQDPDLPVIVMTGHADVATAVQAIQQGAYDFIEKPFGRDRLLSLVRRALQQRTLALENRGLRRGLEAGAALAAVLCGDSDAMRALRGLILRIAATPVDVLVSGETGTGKELVARALHDFSGRSGPYVPLNCAALPEALIESELFGHDSGAFTGASRARVGRIEHAQGGTLFLDEIQAMSGGLQAKLLRVLQEREVQRLGSNQARPVDVRVVAASNAALMPMVADGRFRADLFYRLNVVALDLPPLRDRRGDIAPLFAHFCAGAGLRFARPPRTADPDLVARLLAHDWPGNVRELRSAADRWTLGLPVFGPEATPSGDGSGPPQTLSDKVSQLEGLLIGDALRRCQGQVDAVCQDLAISPATLYRKLKAHGLSLASHQPEDDRPPPAAARS